MQHSSRKASLVPGVVGGTINRVLFCKVCKVIGDIANLRCLFAALAVRGLLLLVRCSYSLYATASSYLLFSLQAFHNRGELTKDLVSLLVVFDLSSNQLREVTQRLGGIKNLFLVSEVIWSSWEDRYTRSS